MHRRMLKPMLKKIEGGLSTDATIPSPTSQRHPAYPNKQRPPSPQTTLFQERREST